MNKQYIISFILGIILTAYLFPNSCSSHNSAATSITKTDTIYVKKPYKEIVIKEVQRPVKVYVYKRDTVFRKHIEKDTLITSVEISKREAKIHTLTPRGIPLIKTYLIPENIKEIQINHQGKAQFKIKKHSKFRKLLTKIFLPSIFGTGIVIGRKFKF